MRSFYILNLFRTSNKEIHKICRGFLVDPGHLANHFEWLTNVPSLNVTVEKNLFRQLGRLALKDLRSLQSPYWDHQDLTEIYIFW